MPQNDKQVCPIVPAPTDREVRKMVAKPMLDMAYEQGLERTGKTLGCCAKTVSRARDEETTLSADTLIALIWNSPAFKNAVLAKIGERAIPIKVKCDTDALATTSGAVHKLAVVTSEASPGGKAILDSECLEIEPDVDAAIATLTNIKQRCHQIREGRAA